METLFVLFSFQNSHYFIITFCESDSLISQTWANKDALFPSFVCMGKADTPDKYCIVSRDFPKWANQDTLSRKLFVGPIFHKWTWNLHFSRSKSRGYKLLSHSNRAQGYIRTNKLKVMTLKSSYIYIAMATICLTRAYKENETFRFLNIMEHVSCLLDNV